MAALRCGGAWRREHTHARMHERAPLLLQSDESVEFNESLRAAHLSPSPPLHLTRSRSHSQGLANTYSAPPEPIDFAAYKAKIAAPGLVDKFEVRIGPRG